MFALGMMIFIQHFRPFKSQSLNTFQAFNECISLILIYIGLCFTKAVLDSEARYTIGYFFITVNVIILTVHLVILMYTSLKS